MKPMESWTIYNRPSDFPNHYAVRRSIIMRGVVIPDGHVFLFQTLEEARRAVPPNLVRVAAHAQDDPVIIETYL